MGKKEKMTRDLPTVVLDYTLSEGEQGCPQCGEHLHEMKTIVRKELTMVPATVHVTERVQHVYTCRNCEVKEIKTPVVYAPMPAPVLTNSVASPSLVAQIMTKKYVEACRCTVRNSSFSATDLTSAAKRCQTGWSAH